MKHRGTGTPPEERATENVVPKNKTVYLVGTVHVSKKSAQKVEKTVAEVGPDVVCVELDLERFRALKGMREGGHFRYSPSPAELLTLPGILRWLQQEVGKEFGVMPGVEMLSAYNSARRHKVDLALIDRPVRTTIQRMTECMPFGEKVRMASYIVAAAGLFALKPLFGWRIFSFASLFGESEELDIKKLERGEGIDRLIARLREEFPTVYRVLVEERNKYMCNNILNILKKKDVLVVVVGAGHVSGMAAILRAQRIDAKTV